MTHALAGRCWHAFESNDAAELNEPGHSGAAASMQRSGGLLLECPASWRTGRPAALFTGFAPHLWHPVPRAVPGFAPHLWHPVPPAVPGFAPHLWHPVPPAVPGGGAGQPIPPAVAGQADAEAGREAKIAEIRGQIAQEEQVYQ